MQCVEKRKIGLNLEPFGRWRFIKNCVQTIALSDLRRLQCGKCHKNRMRTMPQRLPINWAGTSKGGRKETAQRSAINRMSIVKCIKTIRLTKGLLIIATFYRYYCSFRVNLFSSILSCLLLCQSKRFPHENGTLSPSLVRIGIQIRNGTHETTWMHFQFFTPIQPKECKKFLFKLHTISWRFVQWNSIWIPTQRYEIQRNLFVTRNRKVQRTQKKQS